MNFSLSPRASAILVLLLNICVLEIVAWFAFARNIHGLFYHFDGACTYVEIRNQLMFSPSLLSFTNDIFQSIGNLQFLQNSTFLFFFWPIAWFADFQVSIIVVYQVIAAVVFVSAYGLARLIAFGQTVALIAGWILAVLATPFVPLPSFYSILWVAPTMVLMIAAPVIVLWLVQAIGRTTILVDVVAGLGLFVLALYLLSANPSILAVLGPGLVPYLVVAFASARGRSEWLRKLSMLVVLGTIAVALEWPWFLFGLFSHTAPRVMSADFTAVYNDPIYISILFQGPAVGWGGPALVGLASLGAAAVLGRGPQTPRGLAWMLLAAVATLIAFRLLFELFPRWILPPPLYFEIALWPVYAVFASVAVHRVLGFIGRIKVSEVGTSSARWLLPLPAAAITVLLVLLNPPVTMDYPFPPRPTPIVNVLRDNIALAPRSEFNGRVATIIPTDPAAGDPWVQQITAVVARAQIVGNEQFSAHLWYYFVPTLFEYNPFMSPLFHALVKRSLQRPPLIHQRNVTVLTHADLRIMGLLGVRYLISREADQPPGKWIAADAEGEGRWILSELPAPNLASYAPTETVVRRSLGATFDYLLDDRHDLSQSAVVHRDVAGPLVGLQRSSLSMEGSDLRIKAQSSGRSLVIVPLEFSNCIELRDMAPGKSKAELLRVDGLLTGVIFEKEVDAVLAFRTGPLRNTSCRWRDYQDLRGMLMGT